YGDGFNILAKMIKALSAHMNTEFQLSEKISQIKCYSCNGLGHFSRDCKKREAYRQGSGKDECYRCYQSGHWARDCPQKNYGARKEVRGNVEVQQDFDSTARRPRYEERRASNENTWKPGHRSEQDKGRFYGNQGFNSGSTDRLRRQDPPRGGYTGAVQRDVRRDIQREVQRDVQRDIQREVQREVRRDEPREVQRNVHNRGREYGRHPSSQEEEAQKAEVLKLIYPSNLPRLEGGGGNRQGNGTNGSVLIPCFKPWGYQGILPYVVNLELNGRRCGCLVDTGAAMSLIRESLVREENFRRYRREDLTLVGVTGHVMKNFGMIYADLLLPASRRRLNGAFMVCRDQAFEDNGIDILLGRDFLADHDAQIFCGDEPMITLLGECVLPTQYGNGREYEEYSKNIDEIGEINPRCYRDDKGQKGIRRGPQGTGLRRPRLAVDWKQDWEHWLQVVGEFYRKKFISPPRKIYPRLRAEERITGSVSVTNAKIEAEWPRLGKTEKPSHRLTMVDIGEIEENEGQPKGLAEQELLKRGRIPCTNEAQAVNPSGACGITADSTKETELKLMVQQWRQRFYDLYDDQGVLRRKIQEYEGLLEKCKEGSSIVGTGCEKPTKQMTQDSTVDKASILVKEDIVVPSKTEIVYENIESAKIRRNKPYDRKTKERKFDLGDLVNLKDLSTTVGISKKLAKSWTWPYRVIEVIGPVNYKIRKVHGRDEQVVHVNRLKKYYEKEKQLDGTEDEDNREEALNESDEEDEEKQESTLKLPLIPQWIEIPVHIRDKEDSEEDIKDEVSESEEEAEEPVFLRRSTRIRRPPNRLDL
ncbi:hypothetical protein NQ314_003098, partial [Rhamnusium bicolor]